MLPMRKMRDELSRRARLSDPDALTAGRLKRMKSIRRKLPKLSLTRIQDIAGCRAIVASAEQVDQIARGMTDTSRHEFIRENDYLSEPKIGGYRSRHLIFRVHSGSSGDPPRFVELQLRTRLQHAWATAVEAVGLVRNEDLKGGAGDPRWLRLFTLMSAEFAVREGLPTVPGTPTEEAKRRAELIDIASDLSALDTLDSYRRIIDATAATSASTGSVFVIQYDNDTKRVRVRSFNSMRAGSHWYSDEESHGSSTDTVLVEVDRATDLRAAYPNYYLDVGDFTSEISRLVRPVAPQRPLKPDFRWWWE